MKMQVTFTIEKKEIILSEKARSNNDEKQTEIIEASSSQEAIDNLIEHICEQVLENSEFLPMRDGNSVKVMDREENIIERYCNFSVESPVKKLREELGMSRAAAARLLEMPIRTLEDWEYGKTIPSHWVEKLVLEKLGSMSE